MSQLVMMIVRIDDLDNPGQLSEIWRQALPVVELRGLEPEQYLNGVEETVMEVGWTAMRSGAGGPFSPGTGRGDAWRRL